ncbi:MAG TPA: 1,2-phenylacetyl-CoA epoxidase subunit PaaC [Bacillota bacterium]
MTGLPRVTTADQVRSDAGFHRALVELLYQVADDDLILAQRGAEWLGLVPHIEEDVAFSSITQGMFGHALALYGLLEEMGEGRADDLAYFREPGAFRNALLTERENGEGTYLDSPRFDWAYTVVRQYVYQRFKRLRLEALVESRYQPLADLAEKMLREQFYHVYHWEVWMEQLTGRTAEARRRMAEAWNRVLADAPSLSSLGPHGPAILSLGLLPGPLEEPFRRSLVAAAQAYDLPPVDAWTVPAITGREGRHSPALPPMLEHMAEVYRTAPAASW